MKFRTRLVGLLAGYLKLVYKNIDNLRAINLNVKNNNNNDINLYAVTYNIYYHIHNKYREYGNWTV